MAAVERALASEKGDEDAARFGPLRLVRYFLERPDHWLSLKREYWGARMLAARDAEQKCPLRSEEEGAPVFDYLRHLEEERRPAAAK